MAGKAQSKWEQVSELVGRIELSVSSKARTGKPAIPETTGFYVEIRYENAADKMYRALCSSRVAVQNTIKQYFWEHGKFPVQPGKLFKATGNGGMELPNTVIVDRAVANAATMDIADKIRLAKAMGLPIPAEWLASAQATTDVDQDDSDEDEGEAKYPEGSLDKVGMAKLKVLAQNEYIGGYADMTADELRDELYAIEK